MDLTKILSIAGKPGLYKMLAQTKNGLVVESLADQKKFTAFSHEKISTLEEISIYTEGEDKPLKEVLKAIYEMQDGQPAIDHKSDTAKLKDFFEKAVPDYDKENVYVSDIKKIITWYNILQEQDMLDFTEEETKEEKVDEKDDKQAESPGENEQSTETEKQED